MQAPFPLGNFDFISGSKMPVNSVKALTTLEIIRINNFNLQKVKSLIDSETNFFKLSRFLQEVYPSLSKISTNAWERIIYSFRQREFKVNDLIIAEGSKLNSAYLIQEGECWLESHLKP